MSVSRKWCLENTVLPLERRTMDLCSWSGGQASTTKEDHGFLLLSLAGRSADPWLHLHFGKKPKWWWYRSGRSKLIRELLDQYPVSRSKGTKLSLSSKVVVPIEVRGHQILVLNDRRSVVLAFEESAPQFESLEWILNELRLEIEQDKKGNQEEEKKEDKNEDLTEDGEDSDKHDFDEDMREVLESIKGSSGCKNAWWMSRTRRFKVINHLGDVKHFQVPPESKFKKRRTSCSSAENMESTVRQVLADALRWLQPEPLLET